MTLSCSLDQIKKFALALITINNECLSFAHEISELIRNEDDEKHYAKSTEFQERNSIIIRQ